jgi:hypothetical protein
LADNKNDVQKYRGSRKIYWILFPVLAALPSVWFSFVLGYFGESLHLKSDSKLTLVGIIITVLIVLLSLSWSVVKSVGSYKEMQESVSTSNLLQQLSSACDEFCEQKYSALLLSIDNCLRGLDSPPRIVGNPSQQITAIMNKFADCVAESTKLRKTHLVVSLAYNYPHYKTKWRWADGSRCEGLSVQELAKNPSTTFYQISSGTQSFVFHNDKIQAENNNHYVMDARDKSCDKIGSIVCANISVGTTNETFVSAILTVSTYGRKLVYNNDEKTINRIQYNIQQILLPAIESRLKTELSLQFIAYMQYHGRPKLESNLAGAVPE